MTSVNMPKVKKTKKFATVKRMLTKKDPRLKAVQKKNDSKGKQQAGKMKGDKQEVVSVEKVPSHLFFKYNTSLGPPYRILIDTNFINHSIQNKLDIFSSLMDCLLAKCYPCVTDCVMAELEKLGQNYRLALRIAKDPRFTRLQCTHKGTYADDCLVRRVQQHKIYVVATCDKDLKRRLRKIPGVPVMYINSRKYSVERFPDVNQAPAH